MCFVAMSVMAQTVQVTDLKLESWSDPLTVYNDESHACTTSKGLNIGAVLNIKIVDC